MKKLLLTFVMLILSSSLFAEEIFLVTSRDHQSKYYAYTETMIVNKEGETSIMIAERIKGKSEVRSYKGVTPVDCVQGHGTLYHRKKLTDNWIPAIQWTSSGTTVADTIAKALCGAMREGDDNEI